MPHIPPSQWYRSLYGRFILPVFDLSALHFFLAYNWRVARIRKFEGKGGTNPALCDYLASVIVVTLLQPKVTIDFSTAYFKTVTVSIWIFIGMGIGRIGIPFWLNIDLFFAQ
jgi:hypothetical protein